MVCIKISQDRELDVLQVVDRQSRRQSCAWGPAVLQSAMAARSLGRFGSQRRAWNSSSLRSSHFQHYHFMKPKLYSQIIWLLPALPVCLISLPSSLRAFGIKAQRISISKAHDIIVDIGETVSQRY